MSDWSDCKNILCIRADNMGDLIMTSPALRAIKETSNCKITVLTSKMGGLITPFIPEIDETIIHDLPWVKTKSLSDPSNVDSLIKEIRSMQFDGSIIFTVYSQNPLPAAMLAFMSGIPKRLAYCRENPYELLTDWIPEKEPFHFIRHQVQRDLELVKSVNFSVSDNRLSLTINKQAIDCAMMKIQEAGVSLDKKWIIFHPAVSEEKRKFSTKEWIKLGRQIINNLNANILITGAESDLLLCEQIKKGIGEQAISMAGLLNVQEFIGLIKIAPLIISVNTASIHIAAATQTPVIVLYALTNPQHTPWNVTSEIFPFPVQQDIHSNNEIINYVNNHLYNKKIDYPSAENIYKTAEKILNGKANNNDVLKNTGTLVL